MNVAAEIVVRTETAGELKRLASALEGVGNRDQEIADRLYGSSDEKAQLETQTITMKTERDGAYAARDQAIAEMWKARRQLARTRGQLARMKQKATARRKRR